MSSSVNEPEYIEGRQAKENFEKWRSPSFKLPNLREGKTKKSSKKAKERCDDDHDKDEN